MTLTAVYEPSGDDAGVYLASESTPATINTMFHRTRLQVSTPGTIYPGLSSTIDGQVSSSGDYIDRTVRILLDNIPLADVKVSGKLQLELTPPEDFSPGEHNITVSVAPQGRYSGAAIFGNL